MTNVVRLLLLAAMLATAGVPLRAADQKSVAGSWRVAVDTMSLRLDLVQRGAHITGTLQNPHGNPIMLKGSFSNGRLKLTGGSRGGEFAYRVSTLAIVKPDGSLAGILLTNAGDMTWTATRATAK